MAEAGQGPPPQVEVKSLDDYLEVMSKSVFQSGMSWKVVENKWDSIKEALHNFNAVKVAALTERDIEALTKDARVIRNRNKLKSIASNARQMLELGDGDHKGFRKYLRSHGDFHATIKQIGKDFKFMGPMSAYVFLYVVGEDVISHDAFVRKYRKKS